MLRRRNHQTVLLGMWTGAATVDDSVAVYYKVKQHCPMTQWFSSMVYTKEENTNVTATLFPTAKKWKQSIHQVVNRYNIAYLYSGTLFSQNQKWQINMLEPDEPWEHNLVKKPAKKPQIIQLLSYKINAIDPFRHTSWRWWLSGRWGVTLYQYETSWSDGNSKTVVTVVQHSGYIKNCLGLAW